MKTLFLSSILLITFAIAITVFQFSCSKGAHGEPSGSDLTKEQILVQKTWKVDQLMHVISSHYSTYISGGINTTGIPYEKLTFKFNSDGSGTHTDEFGITHSMTWQFISADKRAIKLTILDPNPVVFTWQMVEIAENYLHASVNLTMGQDSDNLESFRLTQTL